MVIESDRIRINLVRSKRNIHLALNGDKSLIDKGFLQYQQKILRDLTIFEI